MKRYIKILFFSLSLFAFSCSDFLDRDPDFITPENYYNTEEQMTKALNGVYNRLIDTNGRMYSKGLYSFLALSDEFYYRNVSVNSIKVMQFDAASLDIGRFWEVLYEGVNRANMLIKSFEKKEPDTKVKAVIKGEALFLRGYYYFLLTSYFGEVPLKLVPTQSSTDKYLAKSTFKQIYDQIIEDMSAAEELVYEADEVSYNERITKTGVQAIMARVFLKMAGAPLNDVTKYDNALEYANRVILSDMHELNADYSEIFINHSKDINDIKECIWEVGMYGNKVGSIDLAGSVGIENGILCPSEEIGYSGGALQVIAKLYQAYEATDLRRDWSIAPYRYVTDATTKVVAKKNFLASEIYPRNSGKWRREYETGTKARSFNSTNFPIIRYSDVLLMKAEAENAVNSGPTTDAYEALNNVRRRAYGKPIGVADPVCDIPSGLGQIDFLQVVQDERYRELSFEGIRKLDLIRWGIYVETMNTLGQSITATAPTAYKYAASAGNSTTSRNVVFPIPNTEITVNKLLNQNKGW